MLRGRPAGEVPAILHDELSRRGAPHEALAHAPTEIAAVEQALAWARPGDLLILLIHSERGAVLDRLERAGANDIEQHILDLGGELRAGLARLKVDLLTPENPERRAGNICFATDRFAELEEQVLSRVLRNGVQQPG